MNVAHPTQRFVHSCRWASRHRRTGRLDEVAESAPKGAIIAEPKSGLKCTSSIRNLPLLRAVPEPSVRRSPVEPACGSQQTGQEHLHLPVTGEEPLLLPTPPGFSWRCSGRYVSPLEAMGSCIPCGRMACTPSSSSTTPANIEHPGGQLPK